MKIFFFLFLVSFAFVSCAEKKPKHLISGKWISNNSIKTELIFSDDKSYQFQTFRENDKVLESSTSSYEIIDTTSVKVLVGGFEAYKLRVNAKIQSDGTIRIQCSHSRDSRGLTIVDLPTICHNHEFRRVMNNL